MNALRELYMSAYYFIYVTLFTVGYGAITPANDYERILNTVIIFFGLPFMIWFFASLSFVVKAANYVDPEEKEALSTLTKIKKEYKLPEEIYQSAKKEVETNLKIRDQE